MIRRLLTPDRLFDHPWRSGHPFCRRTGRLRRWAMIVLLVALIFVIGGYAYLTDANRVRAMAEGYLGQLVGGRVTVGGATLSVFEGLRLDDVKVHVDDGEAADSLLFSAQTFVINYDPRVMLGGRLEATQIIAQKPYVHLTENVDAGSWNWHRLGTSRKRRTRPTMGRSDQPVALPEVMLRNARVEISEIRGGRMSTLGFMTLDGQLLPAKVEPGPEANEGRRYTFDLQSRGSNEGVGPFVTGSLAPGSGQVSAKLMNFEFGRDVLSILPAEVRHWWERHELSGRVNIPVLSYTPPRAGSKPKFKVETELNGVTLAVPAEEWMTGDEARRLATTRQSIAMVGDFYALAGVGESTRAKGQGSSPDDIDAPDVDARPLTLDRSASSPAAKLSAMAYRVPVRLQNVAGKFVFTEDGIEVSDVTGRVENNGIKIVGRIEGYRPDAKATFKVTSFDTENLIIPASPRYVNSLPPQVRELYEELRPQGTGRLKLEITRAEAGARPTVDGQLDVLDGHFVFHKFAYPLRNATGRILFGRDPQTGLDRVAIQRIRGYGIESGPNRDTIVQVDGRIEPLGPTSGVNITVKAENVHSEEALKQAFPPEVREALQVFDAGKTNRFPTFTGDFECRIVRPLGYRTPWSFDTDIKLKDAAGTLVMFPYPLKNVTGDLRVRTGYVDIVNVKATKGDATVEVGGRVAWGSSRQQTGDPRNGDGRTGPTTVPTVPTTQAVASDAARDPFQLPFADANRPKTALKITVRKAPIDADLLAALPPAQGAWLAQTQPSGTLNVDGRVFEAKPAPGEVDDGRPRVRPVDFAFDVMVSGGAMRPFGGAFDVTGVVGRLKVTPTHIDLTGLAGRRGEHAQISADGTIDWAGGKRPAGEVIVSASNLPLDAALYELIPAPAKHAWDELQPSGAADLDVTYKGPVGTNTASSVTRPATEAAAATAAPPAPDAVVTLAPSDVSVGVILRPRGASVTFKPVPYPLEDVKGVVRLDGDTVTLEEITGKHGTAELSLGGVGKLGPRPSWDLKLSAKNVPSDDLLKKALPPAVSELIASLKLTGDLDLDFSRLQYRAPSASAGPATASATATASAAPVVETVNLNPTPAESNPQIDLSVLIGLRNGSLETGVTLDAVEGKLQLDASMREGHLAEMKGRVDAPSMRMTERAVKDFHCDVIKPLGKSELRLDNIQGELAGGVLAGGVKIVYPEVGDGGAKYGADLVLRGADVRALVDEPDSELAGQLTASLAVEGSWDDPAARRGRGDVVASGKKMYKIPLLLGLSQVTNLTVPISSPFNEATARYSIQGQKVAFDEIEMRASNMVMTGTGNLDFASKKVDLTFVTDNPGGLKVPFLNDLFQGARQELLKIHVRGTVQEPQVSAGLMGTFTTTVDEVFKGDPPAPKKKK